MTPVIHGSLHLSVGQIVIVVLFLFAIKAAAMDLREMEKLLGIVVRECLRRIPMTEEEAADRMRMDISHFRKALRGGDGLQLGLAKLMRLGLVFMTYLTPLLLYHVARLHAEQVKEDAIDAAKTLLGRRT